MEALPQVTISTTDRQRLVCVATAALPSANDGIAASMLLSQIARAIAVPPEGLPENVVSMGSEVAFRDNIDGSIERVRIVYPGEQAGDGQALSVLTPLGATLIGLPQGASIEWCTVPKDRKSVTVLRVQHRQELV